MVINLGPHHPSMHGVLRLISAMVEAISHISQVMGLQTVAEYVENDAILQRITALGVDFAQGYGIAKPASLLGPRGQASPRLGP